MFLEVYCSSLLLDVYLPMIFLAIFSVGNGVFLLVLLCMPSQPFKY